MKPEYFGEDQQLFGIYHPPRGNPSTPVRAAVICPPFGQEYIRTHWCLRLLASQLARKGIHVFRFDYFGIGDSWGQPQDVQSLARWERDIELAMDWMIKTSGAENCQLIGLRTGASLAMRVASRNQNANSLVLWEPVHSGSDWLRSMNDMHSEMLDLWVCRMDTVDDEKHQELLGTLYHRQLIDDLDRDLIDWSQLQQPHLIFAGKDCRELYQEINNPMQKVIFTDDESSWCDLRQLETAWLRPQTTRKIVESVDDIFNRLSRFGVLATGEEVVQ